MRVLAGVSAHRCYVANNRDNRADFDGDKKAILLLKCLFVGKLASIISLIAGTEIVVKTRVQA